MRKSTNEATGALTQEQEESGFGPAALTSVGSVALALYYNVRGEKQRGQFVGLWPATILGLAIYLKPDGIKRQLHQTED